MAVLSVVNMATFFGELQRRWLVVFHRQSGQYTVTTLSNCTHDDTENT